MRLASVVLAVAASVPAGGVRIVTEPPGAEVWMGMVQLGTTGEQGLDIASLPGPVVLSIRKEGFQTAERTVTPDPSAPLSVYVRMRPGPAAAPASVPSARRSPAQPPAAPPAAAARRRGKALPLVLGGLGAAAATTAVIVATREDPLEVDDDGDGFSEKQGDCNDLDRDLKPNGGFEFTVDFAFTGTTSCAVRNPRQQVYRVKNNSCTTLTLSSLVGSTNVTGNCTGGATFNLSLSRSSVAPGASEVVRLGAPANGGISFCCSRYPCTAGSCGTAEQYTLTTTAGTRSVTNSFLTVDPTGFTCLPCAGNAGYRRDGGGRQPPPACTATLTHP